MKDIKIYQYEKSFIREYNYNYDFAISNDYHYNLFYFKDIIFQPEIIYFVENGLQRFYDSEIINEGEIVDILIFDDIWDDYKSKIKKHQRKLKLQKIID